METRSIFRNRSLLGTLVVLSVLLQAQFVSATAQAQKPDTGSPTPATKEPTPEQGRIPADHYDPDDVKIYEDVLVENRDVSIRDHKFTVHFYRPKSDGPAIPAIYACGDGGWRGLAPRTAQQLAHLGFAVAGIDSKVYLRELSSIQDPLTIKTLASDYAAIASALRNYATVDSSTPVYVYGWSLGAGFAVAVGSDIATRANWAGVVAVGLPAQNQLVSGLGANYANLKDPANSRYGFRTETVLRELSPVPLVLIESTSDTASPQKVGKALFATAGDPKQYILIKAENHRFSGARSEFYSALANALTWIRQVQGNFANHVQTATSKAEIH